MSKKPKILFLDIETSLITVNTWRVGYNMTIHADQIVKGSHTDIICIGYKWAHEKTVHCPDWGVRKQNSAKMLDEVAKQIEKADVVVGHNGDRFDVKLINTLRIIHNQDPIAWPTTVDTLKMARKHFKFNSNKLDYLSRVLLEDKKLRTGGIDLWNDVQFKKCPKALKRMINYCKKDVILLEDVYNRLAPHCDAKVNMALLSGNGRYHCPTCGSYDVVGWGTRTTKAAIYSRLKCKSCASVFKGPKVS